jgi:hypothetical protein
MVLSLRQRHRSRLGSLGDTGYVALNKAVFDWIEVETTKSLMLHCGTS